MNEFVELNKILALPNWEEVLKEKAVAINWSIDGRFFLLKYNQIFSDFNDPAVRACRGVIYNAESRPFRCVCAPFIKFGNYGEEYCPDIDWKTARVLQKMDGSLMKVWNYEGVWYISTNGVPYAENADVNDFINFRDLFLKALNKDFDEWTSQLDPDYSYMFELTTPENRVIIHYNEYKLWFLSRRNIKTLKEDNINDTGLDRPLMYNLSNLSDCIILVTNMSADEEGVVVNDANFNRVKVKSPEYLLASHLVNNHMISSRRIITMIKDMSIDDFLAYCSEYHDQVGKIQKALASIVQRNKDSWEAVSAYAQGEDRAARKQFAEKAKRYPGEQAFLFFKYSHPTATAESFILGQKVKTLKRLIDKELE